VVGVVGVVGVDSVGAGWVGAGVDPAGSDPVGAGADPAGSDPVGADADLVGPGANPGTDGGVCVVCVVVRGRFVEVRAPMGLYDMAACAVHLQHP
jgi:hypothetical protein